MGSAHDACIVRSVESQLEILMEYRYRFINATI